MALSWTAQREHMVEAQLRRRGIRDIRVLQAARGIPREKFIPPGWRAMSYADAPVYIGHGQTISQPYIAALMAESLSLRGWEKVLEVGAGSGYHAALLGALAGRVIALEIIPELAAQARWNLEETGRAGNVEVVCRDGSKGYAAEMPYDAISVAAATAEPPHELLRQLRDPGRLVIPVGPAEDQELRVITKSGGALRSKVIALCRFVPLRGSRN